MYKILGQISPTNDPTVAPDPTVNIAYTVPADRHVNATIYVSLLQGQTESARDTYSGNVRLKIHVVKSGEAPDEHNCLVYYPKNEAGKYPIKIDNIAMSAGDSIQVFIGEGRLSVEVYGDELQYDFDDLVEALYAINTTRQTKPTCVL